MYPTRQKNLIRISKNPKGQTENITNTQNYSTSVSQLTDL